MDRVRLLIFDWDGTLADSAAQIVSSMQRAIAALGWPARDDTTIRELIGLGLDDVLRTLYPDADLAELQRLLMGYRAQWLADPIGEAALFAGSLEALRALHGQGFRLAVATGKSRRGLDRSLRHHGELAALFANSRTADETASKPNPLMLRELLADEGLQPDEALMIGDTDFDMAMAAALGMPALGVTCGVHPELRLRQAGAQTLLESVAALPSWLASVRRARA